VDCLSVSRSVMTVSPAKAAEPFEMPFGMWTRVGPLNHVSDGIQIPTREGAILEDEKGPAHDMSGYVRRSIYSK